MIGQTKEGKVYIKMFQYKGQMINYFNKVRDNRKVKLVTGGYDFTYQCYVVKYVYHEERA